MAVTKWSIRGEERAQAPGDVISNVEHLDGRRWRARADRADHLGEMPGAAIGKIVTIDRSHHDMYEPELRNRIGNALRLLAVERARQAGLDVAEGAGASTGVAHNHEGRVLLLPAPADVRATRLNAYGVKAVRAHDAARLCIATRARALTRIQSGFCDTGESGRCAFSGWRRRRSVESSTTIPCYLPAIPKPSPEDGWRGSYAP
jgi:hypothetical protein